MRLDEEQVDRFSRQILLREVGGRGQVRLLESRVLVSGTGPAASAAATYLAGAGVGRIGLLGLEPDDGSGVAPLARRCPDTALEVLGPGSDPIDLASWTALVLADEAGQRVAARRAPSAVGPAASMRGRVRLGSVRISRNTGGVGLLLAPGSGAGCDACNLLDVPEIGEDDSACGAGTDSIEGSSDTTALLLAGDMAALAVCRWILDIGADATPRGLWLTNGGAVFAAVGARRRLPCPRACGA